MNFIEAWEEAKKGKHIKRRGWPNKEYFLKENSWVRDIFSMNQRVGGIKAVSMIVPDYLNDSNDDEKREYIINTLSIKTKITHYY